MKNCERIKWVHFQITHISVVKCPIVPNLIQFNLLLSPYPCFISLLYLDLYVLGDDALIS